MSANMEPLGPDISATDWTVVFNDRGGAVLDAEWERGRKGYRSQSRLAPRFLP